MPSSKKQTPEQGGVKKPRKWRRRALIAGGAVAVAVPAMWIAIHEVPGFGPFVADTARAVLGQGVVAWAEDVSYDLQDRVNRLRYKDAKPTTFWDAPSGAPVAKPAAPTVAAPTPSGSASAAPAASAAAAPDFPPPPYTAPYPSVASDGEGQWVPIDDGSGAPPVMYKSLVHPDPKRAFAAVAVVALDLRRVSLHMMPGTQEPANDKIPTSKRPGLIPKDADDSLVAAFNGGFKAIHGHYGMMFDGDVYVAPRDIGCTIAIYKDDSIKIRTWPKLKDEQESMLGWRQTPPCLVEDGKTNSALDVEYNKNWGATVSGETVIRRSAIGIDASGHTLFYGIGEAVTAQALSRAMKAVGVDSAAQLDVNYSYPRFLFYPPVAKGETPRVGSALIPKIDYTKDQYVGRPEPRDFFYVTRRSSPKS
ncbi:MAG TPA: phosphodiester glycosidase family protein [Byssovorax sp.]